MFPRIITLEDRYNNDDRYNNNGDECIWIQQEVKQATTLLTQLLRTQDLNHIVLSYILPSYQRAIINCVDNIDPTPFRELPLIPLIGLKEDTYRDFEHLQRTENIIYLKKLALQITKKKTLEEKKKFTQEHKEKEVHLEKMRKLTLEITQQAFAPIMDKWRDLFDEYEITSDFYDEAAEAAHAYLGSIINIHYNNETTNDTNITSATRCLVRDIYVSLFETHTALQTIIKLDTMVVRGITKFRLTRSKLLNIDKKTDNPANHDNQANPDNLDNNPTYPNNTNNDEAWFYYQQLQDLDDHPIGDDVFIEDDQAPLELPVRLDSITTYFTISNINFNVAELGHRDHNILLGGKCYVLSDGSLAGYGSGWAWKLSREQIHELYLANLPVSRINAIPFDLNVDMPRLSADDIDELNRCQETLVREQDEKVKDLTKKLDHHNKRLRELKKQHKKHEKAKTKIKAQLNDAQAMAEIYKRQNYIAVNHFKRKAEVLKEGSQKERRQKKERQKERQEGEEEEEQDEEEEEETGVIAKKAKKARLQ